MDGWADGLGLRCSGLGGLASPGQKLVGSILRKHLGSYSWQGILERIALIFLHCVLLLCGEMPSFLRNVSCSN